MKDLPINLKYNIATFSNLKINFWGIPKCGSTTIKHILLRADDPSLFNRYDGRKTGSVNWAHGKCKYITPKQAKQNKFKNLAVLRNPVDRLYSMYNSLERLGKDMQGSDQFKKDIKNFFNNASLLNFLDVLDKHCDADRNIHFRSQSHYCLLDDIIKLDLETISTTIKRVHPSLVVDEKRNATTQKYTPDDITVKRIHEIFEEDFNLWSSI